MEVSFFRGEILKRRVMSKSKMIDSIYLFFRLRVRS